MSSSILPPPPSQGGRPPSHGGIALRTPRESDPAAEGLPQRFGKYTLLRKLATGGMAELFLAIQRSVAGFEKLIVIKRILPQMNTDRAFIDMLLHEARIAATLSHPNIVQIFDVGQVDGTYFIAMEHVHGEDIRSIVRQMKVKGYPEFPAEHALGIILGVCAGLAYAHEKNELDGSPLNIVHRDISPQNVVVTFSGDVKIVDFGIAKSDQKLNHETKSGKLKGKVPYMSPEQARGERIDARSDIFATGVMLFELTTGKRLFKGQSEFETLKLICEREYPRPAFVRPGYPEALERIVMKALEKDRDKRYQTAREMQQALEDFVRHERIAVSTIALQQFMQTLFDEMLASQKEALLQGKALADIIELQHPSPASSPDASRPSTGLSMPAASRTVTDVNANKYKKSRAPLAIGALLVAVAAAGIAGGLFYSKRHQPPPPVASLPPAPPPEVRGSLTVTSNPPGAAIWINGDLRTEVTPATIAQLPIGSALEVKLTKDGFEAERRPVTLTDKNPTATVDAALKAGSVGVDISVSPPGTIVTMALDGKRFPGMVIEGISSGDQHKLVVSAPGYGDQSFTFIGAPQEKKHFDVALQKEVHRRHDPPPGPDPVTVSGNGKLNVGATGGWCNITVDGQAKGATPVAGLALPAGVHKLTCTPADGKVQSATVTVPPDGTARYRFTL